MNPGDASAYVIQVESINTNTGLFRKESNGVMTALVANCYANAPGDVVRVEYRKLPNGNAELRVYQNGVLKSTFEDSSGTKLVTGGQFGFFFSGVFTGQLVWKNFNGGVL